MKHALGILLTLLPLAARADLIFVDYEGTVDGIQDPAGGPKLPYAVGDHVQGRLTIDTGRAGPDRSTSPGTSYYGVQLDPYESVDFVSGFWPLQGPEPDIFIDDSVNAEAGWANGTGVDRFWVTDNNSEGRGAGLDVYVNKRGLLTGSGDALSQFFTLTNADVRGPGESLRGLIEVDAAAGEFADFLIDRLSVRPSKCFGPT